MNSLQRLQLRKILTSIVNIRPVYSYDVPSRRLEGQFGGEMMKEGFSEIDVYIQYAPALLNYEFIKDIISRCYYTCKEINAGESLGIRCYLYNDINNGIRLIDRNVFFVQSDEKKEKFSKEIKEFSVGQDIRILNRLSHSTDIIGENALCVFITDNLGCELSDNLKKKNRNISKQSIWILAENECIVIRKGIPVNL
ncbi:hypothetical protein SDC9_64419 [bioreactor metagenome]|uniref:Uncharacterized protein n=1 Tax=bioreactor metagenome TaxID=1076179 RepID=A0A644XQI0_9ZZZZ